MAAQPLPWATGVTSAQVAVEADLIEVYKKLKIPAPPDFAECPQGERLDYLQKWLAMTAFFKGLTAVKPPIQDERKRLGLGARAALRARGLTTTQECRALHGSE